MSCNFLKHKESMLNARQTLVDAGVIDESDKVLDIQEFTGLVDTLTQQSYNSYGVNMGPLFTSVSSVAQPNTQAFEAIDQVRKNLGIYDSKESIGSFRQRTTQPTISIKAGVNDLFNSNPELSKVGSPEQYSQYLDSIFPDSKVKDIVYRGDENYNVGENILSRVGGNKYTNGIYFTKNRREAAGYINDPKKKTTHILSAVLDLKNPKITNIYDKEINTNALSENDIKNFKSKNIDGLDIGLSVEQGFEYLVFEPEQIHILGSKQDIQGFKTWVNNNQYQQISNNTETNPSELVYQFKAVANVSKNIPIITQWFKQLGNTDKFWSKVQQDLQVPKDQIKLLRESEGNNIEEKLASFVANYSYTVEINTATDKESTWDMRAEPTNAKYYSNLTVPGGTNYTEQEIATPAITPSIKGHAQFATDKGIGWFRSDEKSQVGDNNIFDTQTGEWSPNEVGSKTRRILEVQSDLFQKGRNRDDLAKVTDEQIEEFRKLRDNVSYEEAKNYLNNIRENQFLQLLNKDNNWVTFFVKSIIQDSAKNGYEKVLFPTGNTASKVEGHSTLEEFKRQKEDRIKELEEQLETPEYLVDFVDTSGYSGKYIKFNTEQEALDYVKTENAKLPEDIEGGYQLLFNAERLNREINQLKTELERVDKEGFSALRPIFNFYENTVSNILRKQGFKPKLVTDEYGNTWNEVELNESSKGPIYLQQNNNTTTPVNEDVDSKVAKFLASIGVNISKVNTLTDRAGNPMTGIAKADMLNKVIQVVQGQADITTLPEEAAHFFVELLGDDNPMLQEMMKSVTQYKLYPTVVAEYKNNPLYRNEDGTVNFPKIKKEAVGKLIAYHIVDKETGTEFPEQIAKLEKWWEKLWNYVRNIFKNVTTNPFEQAASQILAGDSKGLKKIESLDSTEEYLQLDTTYSKIKSDQQRIHLDDSIDPSTGQKKHIYTRDSIPVVDKYGNPRSVTSVEVDKWYRERFPNDNRSERQKNIDELKAGEGDKIHKDAQNIIERFIDINTGEVKPVLGPQGPIATNQVVYNKLFDYIQHLVSSYEPRTKFMTEVRVYDSKKNLAGSIDLLVLKKDGSADIFDWKSQEINKGQTDLKWFKAPAYRIQLEAYKRILTQEYGITKFGKVRAIPIATSFAYVKQGGVFNPTHVNNVEIGSIDPRSIPEEQSYLLPVVAQAESTDDAKLDKLISQLNAIYEKISQKNFGNNRNLKAEELNKIQKAIRDLQVKKDLSSFIENGKAEDKKYYDKLNDDSITSADILESQDILRVYAESSVLLKEQLSELKKAIKAGGENTKQLEQMQEDFASMVLNAKAVLYSLNEKMKELGSEIAEKNGITNLLDAEKPMDRLKVLFRSLSTLPTRALRTFYKLLSTAQSKRDFSIDELNQDLSKLKTNLEQWADKKGIAKNNMFDYILKFDDKGNWTGEFLDKYSKDFYTKRNEAIKAGNLKWIMDNSVFDEQRYELALESYKKVLDSVVYSTDPQRNQERKEKALEKRIEARDVRKSDFAKINKKNYLDRKSTR